MSQLQQNQKKISCNWKCMKTVQLPAGSMLGEKGVNGRAVALEATASKAWSAVQLACLQALQIHCVDFLSYPNVLICFECPLDRATWESRVSITENSHLTFFGIFTSQYFSLFLAIFLPCQFSSYVTGLPMKCKSLQPALPLSVICVSSELFINSEKCFSSSNQACIFPGPYFECTSTQDSVSEFIHRVRVFKAMENLMWALISIGVILLREGRSRVVSGKCTNPLSFDILALSRGEYLMWFLWVFCFFDNFRTTLIN